MNIIPENQENEYNNIENSNVKENSNENNNINIINYNEKNNSNNYIIEENNLENNNIENVEKENDINYDYGQLLKQNEEYKSKIQDIKDQLLD